MKTTQLKRGLASSALALMLVATSVPAQANAATNADLQAQIQSLLELINNLKAKTGATTSCFSYSQDLQLGKSGTDVTELQKFLLSKGHTIPAGATGYFGGQTQAALVAFQKAQGIAPAIGYFGPLTRAKVVSLCTPTSTPTSPTKPTTPATPNTESNLNGEGSFTRFVVKDGDDTDLEEGDKSAEVLDMEFRVVDGDLKISRIEIAARPDAGNDEQDPWDTFSEFSVWNGKELIGKIDASREKNWMEDSPASGDYSIRISSLNYTVKEDKQIAFTVKASAQKNIKGVSNGEIWSLFIPDDGIRALDKDKAVVTTGDAADAITINIDSEGASDELIIRRTDSDPDATSIQLKEATKSGFETVFAFDIDTDDSNNDIEIRKLPIQLTVSTSTMTTFVRDVRVVVDGTTYTKNATVDGATGIVTFEFSKGELVIKAGDRKTVMVEVDFKALQAVNEGATITGQVIGTNIVAKGSDTLATNQLSGTATGEAHSLYTKGLIVSPSTLTSLVTVGKGNLDDYVTFDAAMQITAFGQDVYIPTGTAGVTYQLTDAIGTVIATTSTAVIDSNAKEIGNYFFIPDGETKTISVGVTFLPGTANVTARMQVQSINFSDSAQVANQTWLAQPLNKYRTPTKTIVN